MSVSDNRQREPGLRFSGGRFDTPQWSATAFAAAGQEFLAFQQTIIAIAGYLYRRDNPRASQLPDHFATSLELGIVDVLRGSLSLMIGVIAPDPMAQQLFTLPHGYYEESIDVHHRVVDEVRREGHSESLRNMPRRVREALDRLGRKLEDDERIVVTNTSGTEYYLDRSIREQIQLSLTPQQSMRDLIAGRITRVEADLSRITMFLCAASRPVNTELVYTEQVPLETIKFALTPSKEDGPIVAARGEFLYEDSYIDTGSSNIEELSIPDQEASQRVQELIEELESISSLSDGWYERDSLAPNYAAIRGARALIPPLLFYGLPFPHAFPHANGSVSLEWSLESVEASIMFRTSSDSATVASWDSNTDNHQYDEHTLITSHFLREWLHTLTSLGRA